MRHLILTITFFSFLIVQNLQAQSKASILKNSEIKNVEVLKTAEYYSLSDKQYESIINLKNRKKISLEDGSIAYMLPVEEIAVAGVLSREQLDRLKQIVCLVPLTPGAPCEGSCRSCPEGYICESITRPSISLDLEQVQQNDLLTIKDKSKILQGKIALIRPSIKKCIVLPSSLRN